MDVEGCFPSGEPGVEAFARFIADIDEIVADGEGASSVGEGSVPGYDDLGVERDDLLTGVDPIRDWRFSHDGCAVDEEDVAARCGPGQPDSDARQVGALRHVLEELLRP